MQAFGVVRPPSAAATPHAPPQPHEPRRGLPASLSRHQAAAELELYELAPLSEDRAAELCRAGGRIAVRLPKSTLTLSSMEALLRENAALKAAAAAAAGPLAPAATQLLDQPQPAASSAQPAVPQERGREGADGGGREDARLGSVAESVPGLEAIQRQLDGERALRAHTQSCLEELRREFEELRRDIAAEAARSAASSPAQGVGASGVAPFLARRAAGDGSAATTDKLLSQLERVVLSLDANAAAAKT